MFKFDLEDYAKNFCDWPSKPRAEFLGYKFVENSDGTVSIYDANNVQTGFSNIETCCEKSGYEFDIENRKCLWKNIDCELDDFKLIINPNGNSSVLFDVDENENCCLDVSFDYKFKFDCHILEEAINGVSTEVEVYTEEINKLEDTLEQIDIQITLINGRIEPLSNVPYVIECTKEILIPTGTIFRPISWSAWSIDSINWSNIYDKTPDSGWNDNLPPSSFGLLYNNTVTKKLCLTNAGLSVWFEILGYNDYFTWVNSDGIDTSVYNCKDFELLEERGLNSSEPLYSDNCEYSLYDKSRANTEISQLEEELKTLNETKIKITQQIETLRGETETININSTCNSVIEFFENLKVSFTLEKLNTETNRLETVYEEDIFNIGEGNFWDYIKNASGSTGIIISGSTGVMPTLNQGNYSPLLPLNSSNNFNTTSFSDCLQFRSQIVGEVDNIIPSDERESLYSDRVRLNDALSDWWQSCWLSYTNKICDVDLIESLKGEKINMSIKIANACSDFSVLLDRIKMTKSCTKVDNVETFISEPPKFELTRVIDNKKSWIANRSRDDRFYDLKYRPAEYKTNHHRLVINTKEVDLSLSPARAVEQDVWCYMQDNNILNCSGATTGVTCGDNCIDLSGKLTTDLVEIDSVEEFTNVISSELIDVKNRQTISSYGTVRMLYDRYNFNSLDFSLNKSSQYDYLDMDNFGQSVGNYWVDLIEQVVPATSIWDSTYVYRNMVFDEQKYKYKHNNFYYKDESNKYPLDNLANDSNVEVIVSELFIDSSGNTTSSLPITYNGVWNMQWTCGPEFLGSVTTPTT